MGVTLSIHEGIKKFTIRGQKEKEKEIQQQQVLYPTRKLDESRILTQGYRDFRVVTGTGWNEQIFTSN
jgi:hypothetical protein